MIGVLIKMRHFHTDTCKGRTPCEGEGNQGNHSISQGAPKITSQLLRDWREA